MKVSTFNKRQEKMMDVDEKKHLLGEEMLKVLERSEVKLRMEANKIHL